MSSESDATVKPTEANQPLKTLGKYQIERKLGQGGMGTVYLATNTDLKKLVALKVLPRDKAKNPILVRRFKAEAQAAGQLEHPNIVAVYDSGEADGFLYIAMEYVEGIDLFEQVRRRGVIPVKRSIEIIKQVASALQHAFEHNIVHRDIKPSNLLLKQDGTVKVTDLGLARSIDDTLETNITRAGTTVGTVDYMAPEQARNSKSADIRSDLYSLGCTWYQMLTGEPPFSEGSVTNKLQAHAIKPLPDPREINEKIPEGLIAVLQRMTAKKPTDRYQTPAELIEDLANSNLTNADISNEIFSDLSDYDMDAVKRIEDEMAVEDAEDEIAHVEDSPVRKKRSIDDVEIDDTTTKPAKRKTRSRVEEADNGNFDEKSQPLKPRPKSTSKTLDDDPEEEFHRDTKRSRTNASDDEADEPSSSKGKRRSLATNESPSPQSGKNGLGNFSHEKRPAQHVPKSLPPKRLPTEVEDQNQGRFNLEFLKFVGIAAGVLAAIGSLGWLIILWGSQVETANNPFDLRREMPKDTVVVATPPPNRAEPTESENNPSVTLIEPTKTTTPDRPTTSDYDIKKQPLPAWASSNGGEHGELPKLTVGPGAASENHFSTLNEALHAADKVGGVIRLQGNGPFLLSKIELGNAKTIVIMAADPQSEPLVILSQSEPGSGMTVHNGSLELRGLHFAVDRGPRDNVAAPSMITVIDGQLYVRRCSFTATGDSSIPATALVFSSRQDSQNIPVTPPDVLLDHVVVRGNGLTALKIDRTTADIVIQDSLLVTGTAPVLDVAGTLNPGFADTVDSKPRRIIRVLRSTLTGRKQLLEFAAVNTSKPPTTALYFLDSICSAEGAHNTAVLLSASRWPSVTSPSSGWLTNLNWTSQSSLYTGFERLVDLEKSSYKVANLEAWQRVWGKKFEPAQFHSLVWHESVIPDLSTVMLHDFDNARLPFHDLTTSGGKLPGCATNQLSVPDFISPSRLAAIGHRPKLPAAATASIEGSPVKKVNLMKEDLGSILNKNDWASGTVFEATGFGLQTMLPARIEGKSLRIVFRQGEGAPLRIQPKTYDQKGRPDQPGLFSIEKGTLELQSAVLETTQSARGSAPPWLIFSRNGSVILRGCQLSGPLQQELPQHQGLITWTMTAQNHPAAEVDQHFLSVSDSLLMTTGVGIRFQSGSGNLFLRNCIIATRGHGIDLQPFRTGSSLLPAIDLQNVTFSAAKAAFRVEAASGPEAVDSPMRLFIDQCAFVTPLEIKPGDAADSTVMECVGPVIEQKQIEWWGNSNGFAKELKSFLRHSGKDPVVSASGWHTVWGESSDIRLLTGPKGVHLKNTLPNKWPNLKAGSFMLDPTSGSASWAEGGRPIGADVRTVEELAVARKNSIEAKPGMPGPAQKTGDPKPTGKKNIGF